MFGRYNASIKLSFIIGLILNLILFSVFFLYQGDLAPLLDAWVYVLITECLIFVSIALVVQIRIEGFVALKVKAIYQDLLPTGIPMNEASLQKDVNVITQSLQKFAKESKLEIKLLKDKENYRKEFIGDLAHELKTPLFMVQSYVYTLLEENIKDKKIREKYLKKAANGVDRLNFIINDLDLITQFETGITSLDIESFDIIAHIHELVEMLEIEAADKDINLICNLEKNKTLTVTADKERITQVLTNLIVNSFKYGVIGGTTEIEINELNEFKILVRVIDNGTGISEEHLPRIFERFYRVEKTRNRNEGGSGLGLAIVKHIIEAHNEQIYVESVKNTGSEFSFTLTKVKDK